MARRAMWKGVITFAEFSVPVKLYTAHRDTKVHFHLVHLEDGARLRQQWVCPLEDDVVAREDVVKGAPVSGSEYVLLEDSELDALAPHGDRTVEVTNFVEPSELDPRYLHRTYHLGPDGDESALASLAAALADTGRIGICTWTMRRKQYLGAIRSADGSLLIHAMRFPDEVREVDGRELPHATLKDRERKVARLLLKEMEGEWRPDEYRDEHQEALRQLVARKAAGEDVVLAEEEEVAPTSEDDLLEKLSSSLEAARERRGGGSGHARG